jgi:hypothetical protein
MRDSDEVSQRLQKKYSFDSNLIKLNTEINPIFKTS